MCQSLQVILYHNQYRVEYQYYECCVFIQVTEKEEDKKEGGEREAPLPVPRGTLTEENKQLILQSEDFAMFIERSSLVMERALAETADILFDLSSGRETQGEG